MMTDPVETVAQAVSMPSSTRPFWISQTMMAPTTAPMTEPEQQEQRVAAPFFGRGDADPLLGLIGLTLFVTSIAVRIALTISAA